MPGIKELKTRIKSIGSTRKITRAMQMVSAAKMRRAQQAALNSRSYSELAWQLIRNLSGSTESENPLLKTFPSAQKTAIIVISSNTGLVGGFNSNLFAKLRQTENQDIAELFVMGRKAKDYSVRFNKNLKADFPKADVWVSIDKIYPLARMISDLYQTGEYKAVYIIYNQFISTLSQKPTVKQLLPFQEPPRPLEISLYDKVGGESGQNPILKTEFLFEPSPQLVLNHLLPRIIESQIYQAVLESDAGEHSARMVTMKNATEAAGDLISDLTLTFNQLRQNKITTELAEITAGKIALE